MYNILPCRNGIFDARKAASLSRPTPAHVNVILEWFENSTDAYLAWCMIPFFRARTVSFALLIFKDDAKSLPRPSGNTVINPPVSTACCATMFCSPSPPQETTISPFNIASLAAWPECSCELATKTCDLFGSAISAMSCCFAFRRIFPDFGFIKKRYLSPCFINTCHFSLELTGRITES